MAKSEAPEVTADTLKKDTGFLLDASSFLRKRTGKVYSAPEEIYDEFAEHMRWQDSNETTAIRDYNYAQEANEKSKAQFGRLIKTWDEKKGDNFFDAAGDYILATAAAPSTIAGVISGGAGKLAGFGAKKAAQLGLRAVLKETLEKSVMKEAAKSAGIGVAVEGTFGLALGAAQEGTRVETGVQEEFTGERTITTGLLSGITGAVPAGLSGAYQTVKSKKAAAIGSAGLDVSEKRAAKAKKLATSVIKKSKTMAVKAQDEILSVRVKEARDVLDIYANPGKDPLPKAEVREGLKGLNDLNSVEELLAKLPKDTVDSITAAAIELGTSLKVKGKERITSAIRRAISEGTISTKQLDETLSKYELNMDQFSLMFLAEVSEAGRTLGSMGKVARNLSGKAKVKQQEKAAQLEKQLDNLAISVEGFLDQAGTTALSKADLVKIAKEAGAEQLRGNALGRFAIAGLRGTDRFRLAMMTGQLATTARNVAGGGFRVVADSIDTAFENVYTGAQLGLSKVTGGRVSAPTRSATVSTSSVAKYLFFDQAEARLVRTLFNDTMPNEGKKFFSTFFESADALAKTGADNAVTKMGAFINTGNRISDNTFKQAIFAGTLDRLVRQNMKKSVKGKLVERSLQDVIKDGDFASISKDTFKEAIDTSLDMVYQKTPSGKSGIAKFGRGVISAHREFPFLISSVLPFPRFVINQLDFISDHAPIIGLIGTKLKGEKVMSPAVLAKQTSGLTMLGSAYAFRAMQDPNETEWYEATDGRGNTIDLRPFAGPLNAFLLAADYLYRWKNDMQLKKPTGVMRDTFQAIGGPSMRAGTGLYMVDQLVEDSLEGAKFQQNAGRFLGDLVNTFTLPISTIRDVVATMDKDARNVPITKYDDFLDVFAASATRSLPSVPYFLGDVDASLSEAIGDEVVADAPRPDIFAGKDMRSIDPFERQLFGLGKRAPKNDFQKTLVKLQMSSYELYRPSDFPYEDRILQEAIGDTIARKMNSLVNRKDFKDMGPELQKSVLSDKFSEALAEERTKIKGRLEQEQKGGDTRIDKSAWEKLNPTLKQATIAEYDKINGKGAWDKNKDFAAGLNLSEKVDNRVKNFNEGGLVDNDTLQMVGEIALGMLPVVGDIIDAKDFYSAVKRDDYMGAAIASIGFIPVVGNGLKKGLQVSRELFYAADPMIQKQVRKKFFDAEGIEPDLDNPADVETVVAQAVKEEKILAGKAKAKSDVLFHGSGIGTAPIPDMMRPHKELGTPALSTSSDPLLSLDTFAGGNLENMYVVRPKQGAVTDVTPSEYDRTVLANYDDTGDVIGVLNSKLAGKLPKSMYTEAETIIQDLGDVEVSRLLDDPKLLAKVRRGAEQLSDYKKSMFGSADKKDLSNGDYSVPIPERVRKVIKENPKTADGVIGLADMITGSRLDAEDSQVMANVFYKQLAKAMKKAQGLGAYTSGAGARGTYDRILNDMARVGAGDAGMGADMADDFVNLDGALGLAIENLVDASGKLTQRGEKLSEFKEALQQLAEEQEFAGAQDAAAGYRVIKDNIMDITNRMNRGGLASRA